MAFGQADGCNAIAGLLEKSGIPVRYRCRSGQEVIRAVKKMGGGVVVCGCRLPDMTADQLYAELRDLAFFLVVARPAQLELCEGEELFRLAMPVHAGELAGSVSMLLQLDDRRSRLNVPRRSAEDEELIRLAKEKIMESHMISEAAAYRFMQRRSMETSSPMAEIARLILRALD